MYGSSAVASQLGALIAERPDLALRKEGAGVAKIHPAILLHNSKYYQFGS